MAIFGKKESCPLCGEKTGLFNMPYQLDSGEAICTKCIILLAGVLKTHQEKLKVKTVGELRKLREDKLESDRLKHEAEQAYINSYTPTKAIGTILMVDEENRLFSKVAKKPDKIYDLDSVVGYEIVENGSSVTSGGLGRAAVGGLLFGGTGAVIGAITGNKKTTNLVSDLKIKLTTNDLDNPVIYIPLIDKPIKSDSAEYRSKIESADAVLASLDILLN